MNNEVMSNLTMIKLDKKNTLFLILISAFNSKTNLLNKSLKLQ